MSSYRLAIVTAILSVIGCGKPGASVQDNHLAAKLEQKKQEAAVLPNSQPKEVIPDPVESFQKIVLAVKERAAKPDRLLCRIGEHDTKFAVLDTTGKWIREEHRYSNIRYDVKKTDSLVSPLIGEIEVTEKEYRFISGTGKEGESFFDTEQDAMRSETATRQWTDERKIKYAWRNQKWVMVGGSPFYPFSDTHVGDTLSKDPGEIRKRY